MFLDKSFLMPHSILGVCEDLESYPQENRYFKKIVATLSKKNEMGAYTRYVTISFFEDKEANAS